VTESAAAALTEAVLEAMPVGVAVVDADQRLVLFNAAYHDSLDMPPNSFYRGMRVADALRIAAYRGVYGPGDPEAQIAAFLKTNRTRPGRLRRRSHNGRSFDVLQAPLPDGGYVVCAIETTALVAAGAGAEKALGRVMATLATLRTGLAAFGPDGALVLGNPSFAALLGLTPDQPSQGIQFAELLDMLAIRDEFSEFDGEAFIAAQRLLDRSRPSTMRRTRPNGQVVDIVSDPLSDGGWTMTVADISALARAEDEARRRADLLHSILEAFPHGVCVYGADHRLAMFNRAYTQVMAGAPLSIGEHLDDIIRKRAAAGEYGPGPVEDIISQQSAFDITRPQMRKRRRPNGTTLDVRTTPLPDGGYISVVTDITPLTDAEEQISRRAGEMAVMLSCIRHGVVLWGADHRLLASNLTAEKLLDHPTGLLTPGRTEEQVLDSMIGRGHFGAGPGAPERARALLELDRSTPYLREIVTPSGRVLEARSDPTPAGGWVSTFTDITEARQAQDELRRAKEAAEAASQAKSRFLATMSHELRTPLNAVIGFSDALLQEAANPTPARITDFATQINEAGRQLLGLINGILDVARIESGRSDLASDRVDVARLIRNCARLADTAAHAAEITLIADL